MTAPRPALTARAPTRLDFGGGWTDVPPYSEREGGCVCNVAVARHAMATLALDDAAGEEGEPGDGESALARAAVARARREGADARLRLRLAGDVPVGAGLGGSSAAGVAAVGALAAWRGAPLDRAALAEASRRVEVEDLGIAGGRQDHYAAAFGGALRLDFGEDGTRVRRLAPPPGTLEALPAHAVVVYTGRSRISGATITAVLDAYARRDARVLAALARMKALAAEMAAALEGGDLAGLGTLVGEHWTHQRALHPSITTPEIDALVERGAAAGAWGAKALGASGGGCVLLLAPAERRAAVAAAAAGLGEVLAFTVDTAGFTVLDDGA